MKLNLSHAERVLLVDALQHRARAMTLAARCTSGERSGQYRHEAACCFALSRRAQQLAEDETSETIEIPPQVIGNLNTWTIDEILNREG